MRVPLHIVERRRERLRDLIRTDGFLAVAEISGSSGSPPSTVRRDLAEAAARGHLTRTRGGAFADYNTTFASLGQRAQWARTAKDRIARTARAQLPRSGVVFLDAGTTVQSLARHMLRRDPSRGLPSSPIVSRWPASSAGARHRAAHARGIFLHRQAMLLGPQSVPALADWKFDAAFLGGEGMDAGA